MSTESLAVCSPHYGYASDSTSGGAVYERELLLRLGKHRVNTTIVLPPGGKSLSAGGVTTRRMKNAGLFGVSNAVAFFWEMKQEYRTCPFQIIRVHDARAPLIACELFRTLTKQLPAILHLHHLDGVADFHMPMLRRLTKAIDVVVVPSKFTAGQAADLLRINSERILIIPNGIDTSVYTPRDVSSVALDFLSGDREVLLFVGSLVPRKNLLFLCNVVGILRKRRKGILLVIAGEGPLRGRLEQHLDQNLLLENVMLLGPVSEEMKIALYNRCTVFVSSSLLEGFGLAPAEAMACGKPVVLARSSALVELAEEGRSGFLASPTDEREFAERVEYLLENEKVRSETGQLARKTIIARFNWEQTAAEVAAACWKVA